MLIPLVWETVLGFTINLLLGIFASKMNKRYLKLESVILCFLGDFNSQIFVIQFICMNYVVTFFFCNVHGISWCGYDLNKRCTMELWPLYCHLWLEYKIAS